ncbi:unnamed protein product, partial [Polarella glacialis]
AVGHDGHPGLSGRLGLGMHRLHQRWQRVSGVHGRQRNHWPDDGSKLSCSCAATPCAKGVPALVNDLSCAGGGMDKAAGSCMMLQKTYGTPPGALMAVAGRGMGNLTDACAAASLIKVYRNKDGLDALMNAEVYGNKAITTSQNDSSVTPANASACQALCAANSACKYFTFLDQRLMKDSSYAYFRGLCFLQGELSCTGTPTLYSDFHGAISGPNACDAANMTAAAATTTAAAGAAVTTKAAASASPAMPLPLTFAAAIIASTGLLSLA